MRPKLTGCRVPHCSTLQLSAFFSACDRIPPPPPPQWQWLPRERRLRWQLPRLRPPSLVLLPPLLLCLLGVGLRPRRQSAAGRPKRPWRRRLPLLPPLPSQLPPLLPSVVTPHHPLRDPRPNGRGLTVVVRMVFALRRPARTAPCVPSHDSMLAGWLCHKLCQMGAPGCMTRAGWPLDFIRAFHQDAPATRAYRMRITTQPVETTRISHGISSMSISRAG